MNRREFLKALLGLGAAITLPVAPAEATEAQVDAAWDQLVRSPYTFLVDEYGTVVEPDVAEPRINADLYGDRIDTGWIESPESLIAEIEAYPELHSHFCALAASELEDARNQLERGRLTPGQRVAAQRIVDIIERPDDDWPEWIRTGGAAALPDFLARVDAWLEEPVNWGAVEHWPREWSGQGVAFRFFESMDNETLDALGMVLVEGDRPGSDYVAAELRQPIAAANRAAEALALPFRFTRGG
jgi:hypothetical protein